MRRASRCNGCGYDITGLYTEVCPECGRARSHYESIRRDGRWDLLLVLTMAAVFAAILGASAGLLNASLTTMLLNKTPQFPLLFLIVPFPIFTVAGLTLLMWMVQHRTRTPRAQLARTLGFCLVFFPVVILSHAIGVWINHLANST